MEVRAAEYQTDVLMRAQTMRVLRLTAEMQGQRVLVMTMLPMRARSHQAVAE